MALYMGVRGLNSVFLAHRTSTVTHWTISFILVLLDMVAQAFNPHLGGRGRWITVIFEVSLVYIVSFRPVSSRSARDTQ